MSTLRRKCQSCGVSYETLESDYQAALKRRDHIHAYNCPECAGKIITDVISSVKAGKGMSGFGRFLYMVWEPAMERGLGKNPLHRWFVGIGCGLIAAFLLAACVTGARIRWNSAEPHPVNLSQLAETSPALRTWVLVEGSVVADSRFVHEGRHYVLLQNVEGDTAVFVEIGENSAVGAGDGQLVELKGMASSIAEISTPTVPANASDISVAKVVIREGAEPPTMFAVGLCLVGGIAFIQPLLYLIWKL